jgi:death-on-curing protein
VTDYLTLSEIEAIHADQVARYGGTAGLRDPGQLEAALYRPQTGYYADLIAEAAALWESLSQNHPFFDGNKRTALAAADTFLAINGIRMTADAVALWAFLDQHYSAGTFSFDVLDTWLRTNTEAAS